MLKMCHDILTVQSEIPLDRESDIYWYHRLNLAQIRTKSSLIISNFVLEKED